MKIEYFFLAELSKGDGKQSYICVGVFCFGLFLLLSTKKIPIGSQMRVTRKLGRQDVKPLSVLELLCMFCEGTFVQEYLLELLYVYNACSNICPGTVSELLKWASLIFHDNITQSGSIHGRHSGECE